MKKYFLILLLIVVVAISWVGLSVFLEYTRTTTSDQPIIVEIPQGASESQIAAILKDKGVINYEINFKLKMLKSEYRGKLNYGKFLLYKNMRIEDVIEILARPVAKVEGAKLTIPEGYSAEMIAKRCEELGICPAENFLNELATGTFDYTFISEIPNNENAKYKLQGYLFPSTYYFPLNTPAHEVIDELLAEFESQHNSFKKDIPADMTLAEVINRAALIEREAKLDEERAMISGVIQNRLDIGMRLQIDASAVYAATNGLYDLNRVYNKHTEIDSPYNTYVYTGLPAGPICNPGIKSIRAAMAPTEHDYLFYHTDTEKNDGSHIFTKTYDEHLKGI